MGVFQRLKDAARRFKHELSALYIASRDPRTPWAARIILVVLLAYAASPIDLIPDFIPVLGYLDELLLLPLGIWLALRLIPPEVMSDARNRATTLEATRKPGYWAAGAIVALWIALLAGGAMLWFR